MTPIEIIEQVQKHVDIIHNKRCELQPQYDALNKELRQVEDDAIQEITNICTANGIKKPDIDLCGQISVYISFSEKIKPTNESNSITGKQ